MDPTSLQKSPSSTLIVKQVTLTPFHCSSHIPLISRDPQWRLTQKHRPLKLTELTPNRNTTYYHSLREEKQHSTDLPVMFTIHAGLKHPTYRLVPCP